jgi:hypothetical protein
MAQKPLASSHVGVKEIEEVDESKNVVASYFASEGEGVDVVVSLNSGSRKEHLGRLFGLETKRMIDPEEFE